jgi:cystathionine gamma-synthase
MERNSRDFKKRVHVINQNAEAVCDLLKSTQSSYPDLIKDVCYPKYVTRENYEACRAANLPSGVSAFGGLFSVTFHETSASHAFFDTLLVQKGPSLGTNFTLASPYVVLAHYAELDWAKEFGVEEGLVRVSVGIEDREALLKVFENALDIAKAATEPKKV